MGQLPASWHIFAVVFLGAIPDHYCNPPYEELEDRNSTFGNTFNGWNDGTMYQKCEHQVNNQTDMCYNGWTYSSEPYGTTIVSQWDLVCDRASLVEFSQSVLIIGVTVGSIGFGYLADRYGRRQIFFLSLFVQGILGCLEATSTSFVFFVIVRLFMGIADQGYELTLYAMVSEWFTPRCRPFAFLCLFFFWAGGIMTLPILAYFIRNWRSLQLAMSIPFLFFPLLYWVIPESPRWLLSVGRQEEAHRVLRKIAKLNGRDYVEISLESNAHNTDKTEVKEKPETNKDIVEETTNFVEPSKENPSSGAPEVKVKSNNGASYLDLFRGYRMTMVSIVIFAIWLVSSISYYGLTLNAGRLVGDPYLNFFLSGLVEIPSTVTAIVTVTCFGRRVPICTFFALAGVACYVTAFIPKTTDNGVHLTAAIVATAMLGKYAITASYQIICLCAAEIFPTVVRNKGIAFVAIAARMGAMIAPFVNLLEDYMPKVPMIIYGTVALFPSLLVFLLPEMKGRPQPQTIAELNQIFKEKKFAKRWKQLPTTDENFDQELGS